MKRLNYYFKYSSQRFLPLLITPTIFYNQTKNQNYYSLLSSFLFGITSFGLLQASQCEEKTKIEVDNAPGVHDNLPIISRAEVTRHKTVETRIWTTFKNGNLI